MKRHSISFPIGVIFTIQLKIKTSILKNKLCYLLGGMTAQKMGLANRVRISLRTACVHFSLIRLGMYESTSSYRLVINRKVQIRESYLKEQ